MGAGRAIGLVAEVSGDAHVTEAVTARRQKRVLHRLHANRTQKVSFHLRRRHRQRLLLRRIISAAEGSLLRLSHRRRVFWFLFGSVGPR